MGNRNSHVGDHTPPRNPSAAEIQRRLHDTRDSITNTVAEMKTTMNYEYQHTKDSVTQSLDWKYQMRKYPIAACLGALAVGYFAGRGLSSNLLEDDDVDYNGQGRIPAGTSLDTQPHTQRHIVSPATRARISNRVENVLGDIAENFLAELTRVGRDVLVPSLIGAVSAKLNSTMHHDADTHKPAAFGGTTGSHNPSLQGRNF